MKPTIIIAISLLAITTVASIVYASTFWTVKECHQTFRRDTKEFAACIVWGDPYHYNH